MDAVLNPQMVIPKDAMAELRKLNPQYIKIVDEAKPHEKIVLLRAYDIRTPYEEMCIQLVLDKVENIRVSSGEEEKVRLAMAKEMAEGIEIDSPEKAQEWEERLKKAREIDMDNIEKEKENREKAFGALAKEEVLPKKTKKVDGDNQNSLKGVKGLGVKSVAKLEAAGIKTEAEFSALSYEQKLTIVGPVVAEYFHPKK